MTAIWRMGTKLYGTGIGECKDWSTDEHQRSYRGKQKKGQENMNMLYLTPASNLRIGISCADEDAIRIVRNTKRNGTVWYNFELFRTSTWDVYKAPEHERMLDRNDDECQIDKLVHKWHRKRKETLTVDSGTADESATGIGGDVCTTISALSLADAYGSEHEQGCDKRF